ncbi:hypothetical protein BGZ63DRAFT_367757 [Mariannaea sp. PMI_226]|nr:hypothetical protein BGZ63DRAFT_367757 [Mariannaea sp. PMI_226]
MDVNSNSTKKRRLQPVPRASYLQADFQRKRASTACQLCRTRKTKCDNQRPNCSKCRDLGARCVYHDQPNPASYPNPIKSEILDRLDYLIQLVEPGASSRPANHVPGSSSSRQDTIPANKASLAPYLGIGSQDQDISWDTDDTRAVREDLSRDNEPNGPLLSTQTPQTRIGLCEDILEWPIFQGKYDRRRTEALIFDPTLTWHHADEPMLTAEAIESPRQLEYQDPRQSLSVGRGMREEDIMHLIETFLLTVHIKNPILDPGYLRKTARSVAENGFGWEAQSCLVLIACALAAIASPFTRQPIPDRDGLLRDLDNSLMNTPGYSTAELYYTAARKRIGLITNTLLATECHFLTGVYEMYSLRPLQASISFNRACVAFQTLAWMKPESYIADCQSTEARVSRLYWSCLKSEHEMSIEFRFPSSGLARLNYTSSFPPPPAATAGEQSSHLPGEERAEKTLHMQESLDRGWYYYLADIAARRMLQRVIDSFYTENEVGWDVASLPHLIQTARELQRQLDQWSVDKYRTLPGVIFFDVDLAAEDELAYHLQARAFEIKERIYRPFLFRMIHQPLEESERATLLPLVQVHINTCIRLTQQWNVRHRHHGTWLMVRQSFASALLLMAAQKARLVGDLSKRCEESVNLTVLTLRYWEAEAPDLKASRLILEDIVENLYI